MLEEDSGLLASARLAHGVSIVVPVFNSAETIDELSEAIVLEMRKTREEFEIILVNDGSSDSSWESIAEAAQKLPEVVGIDLSGNFGQHNALLCGIRTARFDTTVTMDDDLQHPPDQIPVLLEALNDDNDVVYGSPLTRQHGLTRALASRLTRLALQRVMGADAAAQANAFRAFRTTLREAFANYESVNVSVDVLLTWSTDRFTYRPVTHNLRQVGRSGYTPRKLITHALNMVTGYSILPLQIASLAGFVFTGVGATLLTFVVVRWAFSGTTVPGFTFLAAAISLFSGVQLFALGVIGEYLARIHFKGLGKPTYVPRRVVGGSRQRDG